MMTESLLMSTFMQNADIYMLLLNLTFHALQVCVNMKSKHDIIFIFRWTITFKHNEQ